MPRKNIYIRNEDESIWESLSNKSEFLHIALRTNWDKERLIMNPLIVLKGSDENILEVQKALNEAKVPKEGRYVQTPEGVFGPTKLEPKTTKTCRNGHPLDKWGLKCLQKGCKYA